MGWWFTKSRSTLANSSHETSTTQNDFHLYALWIWFSLVHTCNFHLINWFTFNRKQKSSNWVCFLSIYTGQFTGHRLLTYGPEPENTLMGTRGYPFLGPCMSKLCFLAKNCVKSVFVVKIVGAHVAKSGLVRALAALFFCFGYLLRIKGGGNRTWYLLHSRCRCPNQVRAKTGVPKEPVFNSQRYQKLMWINRCKNMLVVDNILRWLIGLCTKNFQVWSISTLSSVVQYAFWTFMDH